MTDPCPPPRMTRVRREVEINSAICDLQLKLDMTDLDMVQAVLAWVSKTLTFSTVREAVPAKDPQWPGLNPDSLPDTLKRPRDDL